MTARVSRDFIINGLIFMVGSLLSFFSYGSIEPFVVAFLFGIVGFLFLLLVKNSYDLESKMYFRVFTVYWLISGVASIYANYFDDPIQNDSDPAFFYEISSSGATGLTFAELSLFTEGSGAIVLWRSVYELFSDFGFEANIYIGILVNVLAVSIAAILSMKMMILMFGKDLRRSNLLINMFSFCGILWLFSAIHMRDGVIFLGVTTLIYFWVRYIVNLSFYNLLLLILFNLLSLLFFGYLRSEFLFVPIAMGIVGVLSLLMFQRGDCSRAFTVVSIASLGLLIFGGIFMNNYDLFLTKLTMGQESYLELSTQSASQSSLGVSMIVNQPFLVRLLLGSMYLFVFPVPFWIGFFSDSAYLVFKSCNVLFFYFLTPLFMQACRQIYRSPSNRSDVIMFLFMSIIGFTATIAITSSETRHFGAFLVPLFLISLLPDLGTSKVAEGYKLFRGMFLLVMLFIHLSWLVLKA